MLESPYLRVLDVTIEQDYSQQASHWVPAKPNQDYDYFPILEEVKFTGFRYLWIATQQILNGINCTKIRCLDIQNSDKQKSRASV